MAPVTRQTSIWGGGFQNGGDVAKAGVGHDWLVISAGDIGGAAISDDGILWRQTNIGLYFGTHHFAAAAGSKTVANRIWAYASQDPDGTPPNSGRLLRGTYSGPGGYVTWTNPVTIGPGTRVHDPHPRPVGRMLALDEANDTLYMATGDGIWRVTISTFATSQRALAGGVLTGICLDGDDPQVMYACVESGASGAGIYRLTNMRSGTVTATRYAGLSDPRDVVWVNHGGTRQVYVATAPGPYRWAAAGGDITTGWTSRTSGYNPGNNACGHIDAVEDPNTGQTVLLTANNGGNSSTSAGAWSPDGGTTWHNEADNWQINSVPRGSPTGDLWWMAVNFPRTQLNNTTWKPGHVAINPADPKQMYLFGRSGVWLGIGGSIWRPSVVGSGGTNGDPVCAAQPDGGSRAAIGMGDWTAIISDPAGFSPDVGQPNAQQPQNSNTHGICFREDTGKLGIALEAGEVWTTANPFAASPTWVDNGFSAIGGGSCNGLAIGQNASGQEVILTVRGTNVQRKVGGGTPSNAGGVAANSGHYPKICWPRHGTGRALVYVADDDGLLRSSDYGATFSRPLSWNNTSDTTLQLHADPGNPDTLYVALDDNTSLGTGLFKITNASGSPTKTKIGPTIPAGTCGPCAVDPISGVVYVCTKSDVSAGDAKLYKSPGNNPGAATTFVNVTDQGWAGGPIEPHDMTVTWNQEVLVANRTPGSYIYAEAAVPTPTPTVVNATATSGFSVGGTAAAQVVAVFSGTLERALTAATATSASATSLSVTPGGIVAGDLLVAEYATVGVAATHVAPAGWQPVGAQLGGSGTNFSVWRKPAAAGEAGPYAFTTAAGSTLRMAVAVRAFIGVDPDTPVDGEPASQFHANVTSLTYPSLPIAGPNRIWMLATAKRTATGTTSTFNTPSATTGVVSDTYSDAYSGAVGGFTETVDTETTSGTQNNVAVGLHYKAVSGTADAYTDTYNDVYGGTGGGTTGTAEVTSTDTSLQTWAGLAFLLQPSGGAAAPVVVTATATSGFSLGGTAVASVVGGITPPPPAPGVTPAADEPWFNGSWWPKVHLLLSIGDAAAVGSATFRFDDAGNGFDRGIFAGGAQVDLARHIRSIAIGPRGRDTPIDSATPCPATIVLNNGSTGGNGDYDPDNPLSPYYPDFVEGMGVEVVAERPIGTFWRRFVGKVSSISLDAGLDPTVTLTCADALEGFGRAQLPVQNIPVGGGERSGQRIARILDAARHPTSQRSLDTGYAIVAPTTLGDSALELLRQVELTEFGLLFVDGAGTVVFYDRHRAATAPRSTTVQARITDTAGPGEPAMVELTLDWSRDRIYNDVHVTRQPVPNPPVTHPEEEDADDTPVEQVAGDFTSQDVRGILSLPAAVGELLVDDAAAAEMAQGLVLRFAGAAPARIRQVSVNALTRDLWDVLLPLGLLDRIYVRRDYGPRVIAVELLIQAMTETITSDPPGWELEFTTAEPPPTPSFWRFDSSTFGVGTFGW